MHDLAQNLTPRFRPHPAPEPQDIGNQSILATDALRITLPDETAVQENYAHYQRNDRLALPRCPNFIVAGGFGSRGLLWAALAARWISDELTGAAPVLPRELREAIDPARFMRRTLRKGHT